MLFPVLPINGKRAASLYFVFLHLQGVNLFLFPPDAKKGGHAVWLLILI